MRQIGLTCISFYNINIYFGLYMYILDYIFGLYIIFYFGLYMYILDYMYLDHMQLVQVAFFVATSSPKT